MDKRNESPCCNSQSTSGLGADKPGTIRPRGPGIISRGGESHKCRLDRLLDEGSAIILSPSRGRQGVMQNKYQMLNLQKPVNPGETAGKALGLRDLRTCRMTPPAALNPSSSGPAASRGR